MDPTERSPHEVRNMCLPAFGSRPLRTTCWALSGVRNGSIRLATLLGLKTAPRSVSLSGEQRQGRSSMPVAQEGSRPSLLRPGGQSRLR